MADAPPDQLAELAQEAFAAQQDKKVMKKLKIRAFPEEAHADSVSAHRL
jgi:hypothetical protein